MVNKIFTFFEIVNGIFLILVPYFFVGACEPNEDYIPSCNFSVKMEIVMGIIIVLDALILLKIETLKIAFIQIINNLIAVLIPIVFVRTCRIFTMRCNKTTFPVIYFFCAFMITVYLLYILSDRRDNL